MKPHGSLHLQMFMLLGLYLAAFVLICFFCFNAQFGIGWEALVRSPVGDRVDTIADAIDSQLSSSSPENWSKLLKNFEKIYNVSFYVFNGEGEQVAGDKVQLPPPVRAITTFPGPPPHFGPPHFGPPHFRAGEGPDSESERAGRPGKAPGSEFRPDNEPGREFRPEPPPEPMSGPPPAEMPNGPPPPEDAAHAGTQLGATPRMTPPNLGPRRPHHLPPDMMHAHGRFILKTSNPTHFWVGCRIPLFMKSFHHVRPGTLLARTDNLWGSSLLFDVYFVVGTAAAVICLTILFWYPFIYSITRALSDVTLATENIAEGKFDTRLKVRGRDEIGRLSEAVNRMADRLNNFVKGQKRFLGDIAHELFSPLARLHAALELLDESVPSEHRELINDIREEVEEMNTLLHELLAYSKAGLQEKQIELLPVNLADVVNNVISRLGVASSVEMQVDNSFDVLADRLLLDRSISNIIRNAVRYAGDAGPVIVKAVSSGSEIVITVMDRGPGVAPEMLSRLGEPFFRPEAARTRSSGGVGLGLAIVKSCVESCAGTIAMRNRTGGGFEVEMRLRTA